MQFVRRIISKCAIPLAALLLILSMQAGIASAATKAVAAPQIAAHSLVNRLRERLRSHGPSPKSEPRFLVVAAN